MIVLIRPARAARCRALVPAVARGTRHELIRSLTRVGGGRQPVPPGIHGPRRGAGHRRYCSRADHDRARRPCRAAGVRPEHADPERGAGVRQFRPRHRYRLYPEHGADQLLRYLVDPDAFGRADRPAGGTLDRLTRRHDVYLPPQEGRQVPQRQRGDGRGRRLHHGAHAGDQPGLLIRLAGLPDVGQRQGAGPLYRAVPAAQAVCAVPLHHGRALHRGEGHGKGASEARQVRRQRRLRPGLARLERGRLRPLHAGERRRGQRAAHEAFPRLLPRLACGCDRRGARDDRRAGSDGRLSGQDRCPGHDQPIPGQYHLRHAQGPRLQNRDLAHHRSVLPQDEHAHSAYRRHPRAAGHCPGLRLQHGAAATVSRGAGQRAAVSRLQDAYNSSLPLPKQDLAAAKAELAKSKYAGKGAIPLTLSYVTTAPFEAQIALLFNSIMSQIGFKVTINPQQWNRITELATKVQDTPNVTEVFYDVLYPSPDSMFFQQYDSKANGSWASMEWLDDPVVDSLIAKSRLTVDNAKRNAIYKQIQARIVDLQPDAFMLAALWRQAVRPAITGTENIYMPAGAYQFYNLKKS